MVRSYTTPSVINKNQFYTQQILEEEKNGVRFLTIITKDGKGIVLSKKKVID